MTGGTNGDDERSPEDAAFLRAIREIEDSSDGAETPAETGTDETAEESDRIAELEARIERLEEQTADDATESESATDDRVELAEEVAALRETTDRLESRLDEALDELDAIHESEYGALDEKREQQFETAVKSMVAFHQLATEVLDVRVENYEPAAGHADAERVEATRERIVDALDVGQNDGGIGPTLETSDEEWPDPEEAAREGRVFSGGDEPETTSDAPESGVYPPVGEDDAENEGSGSLPESVRADADIVKESTSEDEHAAEADTEAPWRLTRVDPGGAREVRDAVLASDAGGPPDGEAYARIVGEPSVGSANAPEGGSPAPVDDDD
ncbi:hypothetical protein [Halolamina salina]|uniref:Uncharacterized protein n=1 Tax=Halolamina salina TaxID=1220023 RepID=A0ABD6B7Y3_9EURY